MKLPFLFFLLLQLFLQTNAQKLKFNYICPVPGSGLINPEQVILLKTGLPPDTFSRNSRPVNHQRENNLPPDYPAPTSVFSTPAAADGYIFFTPTVRLTPQYQKYLTIWDNYGTPVYYKKVDKTVTDFKVLDDGILAFAVNGFQNPELDCYYLMDSNYDIYDSVRAGNGYYIDNHDILLMENGHFLILIYDQQVVNMSQIVPGGDPAALVTGLVIQEVDNNGNVYFQWRSWDHYEITDATWDIDLTSHWIDYVHANALELDADGNILVSCRHMDEITKIDYTTGEIIWRFGLNAENNLFTFTNDPIGFSHQHDIRKLQNGNYTVYDNGNLHVPPFSRAVEYHLNELTMQATLVWEYQHDPGIYASLTGGNQRLPNNNRLIGWGGTSPLAVTEVNSSNQVVLEIFLPDSVTGYRARKYPWETTVFTTQDAIDFGNYEGYSTPKKYLLQITNTYSQPIQITSTYNLDESFNSANLFPVNIQPGGSVEIQVLFEPEIPGIFQDVLTLNYDNSGNTERIARQVSVTGIWDPELPSIQFNPANGTQNIDPATLVTATFDEPVRKIFQQELLDEDVPNLFEFKKTNLFGENVAFHGMVSDDKTIVTIVPDEDLEELQQHFIMLKPDKLEDYDGNVITYSEFTFFTTSNAVSTYESSGRTGISIAPNPVSRSLQVESSLGLIRRVDIFSVGGTLLLSVPVNAWKMDIDPGNLPKGILIVNVTGADGKTYSSKIIKD
jgi:hypothetical protein